MQNTKVIVAEQEIAATAFTLNYDLCMAISTHSTKEWENCEKTPTLKVFGQECLMEL